MGQKLLLLLCPILLFSCLANRVAAAEVSVADSIKKYRFLARTSREKNDFVAATGYYGEYLKYETQPKRRKLALYYLGRMHYKNKQPAAAGQAFLQVVELDSLHINSNLMLYEAFKASHPDTAARALERVLIAKPADAKNRRKLADFYRRQNRVQEAISHYVDLAEAGHDAVVLYELLANLYQDLGDSNQALQWRRRLAAAQGMSGQQGGLETLESVAELEIESGDVQAAFNTLIRLAELDSLNRFSYYNRIAGLGEKTGDKKMQLAGLEGKVEASSKDLESLAGLVEWHLNADDRAAAQQWLDRGLRVDATHAHLQLLQGDLLTLEGREEEAVAAFEKAKADPLWQAIAQQRIWQLRPPETEEEKLKKAFFGGGDKKEE